MEKKQSEKLGNIQISDDTIMAYAAKTTLSVPGVSQLAGGLTESISKSILGIDTPAKGVKLSRSDEGLSFDIYVVVDYQVKIPQLAWDIQGLLKKEIEKITNFKVLEVNIHVQGVNLPKEEK